MSKFSNFFRKYYFFLSFLALETIALVFTIPGNERSRALFINSSNTLSSVIYSKYYNISEYFSLRDINSKLFDENLKLRKNLYKSIKNKDSVFVESDTLRKIRYKYFSGQVVKNSVLSENNFITINKGSKDGITKEMGVISQYGVVGIVVNVSRHYCVVLSVLNKLNGVSCKLKNQQYFGFTYWNGNSYRNVVLDGIPNHIKISKGDTVVTSGYSTYFPKGIPIGVIVDFEKNIDDNFFTIKLQLTTDFKKLTNVYLIKNNLSTEQLKIEQKTQDIYK
ncbi:MAG: rod shape-determining protein MreC [Bacteroidota bacterium]|nr:rod shape-determining protein MreC [Bacteroidota bacterium]